jgi:FixJ family two-component response regulator
MRAPAQLSGSLFRLGNSEMTEDAAVIYVVDDDKATRHALSSLLRSIGLVVALFESADDFLKTDFQDVPGCLVLDVRMPGRSGLDLQSRLTEMGLDLPIVFMTGHCDIPMAVQAIKAGAVEILTKPFRDQDMLDAIQQALARDGALRREKAENVELLERFESLTRREREVMLMVVEGRLNKQIAAALGTSEVTVKLHRGHAMRKMHAGSAAELGSMAMRLKAKRKQPA